MAMPAVLLPPIEDEMLWDLLHRAEEIGLRLEVTDSGIVWEVAPGFLHQDLAVTIYSGIQPDPRATGCECVRALDVYVRFPSGLVKRPDLSIFCRRPEQEEGFVRMVPEAVVEITSPGYEAKDLVSGPPLYLANGVKDVVVLDRGRGEVHHTDMAGTRVHTSPVTLALACGCSVTL